MHKVELYGDIGFGGPLLEVTANGDLPDEWKGRASSLKTFSNPTDWIRFESLRGNLVGQTMSLFVQGPHELSNLHLIERAATHSGHWGDEIKRVNFTPDYGGPYTDDDAREATFVTLKWWSVLAYSDADGRGRAEPFLAGKYLACNGQLDHVRNDALSSIYLPVGYSVRVCESEGYGDGSGDEVRFSTPGLHNIPSYLNDKASFLEVVRTI